MLKSMMLMLVLCWPLLGNTVSASSDGQSGQGGAIDIPAQVNQQVRSQADKLVKATLSEDYEGVIALTYPPIIAKIGGASMAAKIAYEAVRLLNERGVKIANLTVGEPINYFVSDTKQLVVLNAQLELASEQGKVNTRSFLLAIKEQDQDWLFIDNNALKNTDELKVYFPALPDDFSLPQKSVKFTPANNG
ncbi:hypothetical protein [Motilimonas eburnea]|uniref:hypothetical protein n=1 Tax=Motilimonas eburnea TaxID=1737488 RepID=UPI001E4C0DFD|nr:hypothetical protein [Motilimonas eburnea]MCE2572868.1 hypothetical protein [Motilimonas eburnea]